MDALTVFVRAVGWTLIHSLWIGTLAAAAYAVMTARLRNQRPQSAYALGLLCIFALVVGLAGSFAYELDAARAGADERAIAVAYAALPVEHQLVGSLPLASATPGSVSAWIEPLLPALVLLWGMAVLGIGSGLLRTHLALRRLVAAGSVLPQLSAPVVELARAFGVARPIAVVSSAIARVPFVIGHFAPVIVLPLTIAAGMPWPQLRLILAHEIAHLRRADYLVNWLQLALEVLLFFHPAVRWLSEELRSLREACCDDLVVAFAGGRGDYTRALLSLEEFRHEAPLLAPSAVAGGLLWRVQRIAGRAPSTRGGLQKLALPTVVLALAVSLIGGGLQLRPASGTRDFVLPQLALANPVLEPVAAKLEIDRWQRERATPAPVAVRLPPPRISTAPQSVLPQPSLTRMSVEPAVAAPSPLISAAAAPTPLPAASQQPSLSPTLTPTAQPLVSRAPVFPARQRPLKDELAVDLRYRLDGSGRVIDIQASSATPGVHDFIAAARDALAHWRFAPEVAAEHAGRDLQHRFVFRDSAQSEPDNCSMNLGTRICVVTGKTKDSDASGRCESTTGSRLCRR